jgi:hypothetical protein
MGNMPSKKDMTINFEDMQRVIHAPEIYFLIHTFPKEEQECLIYGSTVAENEEAHINTFLQKNRLIHIVVYGKHADDDTPIQKMADASRYLWVRGISDDISPTRLFAIQASFPTKHPLASIIQSSNKKN